MSDPDTGSGKFRQQLIILTKSQINNLVMLNNFDVVKK